MLLAFPDRQCKYGTYMYHKHFISPYFKAHIPLKTRLRWVPNANKINTKKHETNQRNLHLGPNATYIPLTCLCILRYVTQILGLALDVFAFLDTNMLV